MDCWRNIRGLVSEIYYLVIFETLQNRHLAIFHMLKEYVDSILSYGTSLKYQGGEGSDGNHCLM